MFLHAQPLLPPLICNNCVHISLFNFLLFFIVFWTKNVENVVCKRLFTVLLKIAFWDPLGTQKNKKNVPLNRFLGPPWGSKFATTKKGNGFPSLTWTTFVSNLGSLGPLFRKNINFYPPLDPKWGPLLVDFGSNVGQIW